MEEERRLCYVAITRAKSKLTISYAKQRMLYGRTSASLPSRFLREIPEDLVLKKGGYQSYNRTAAVQHDRFESGAMRGYGYTDAPKRTTLSSSPTYSAKAPALDLNKGDMVQHTAFGRGMVLSVMKMGGDALLEIAFDEIGTKKLMANTASAHMKRL